MYCRKELKRVMQKMHNGAVKIQKVWKGFKAKTFFAKMKKAAVFILICF